MRLAPLICALLIFCNCSLNAQQYPFQDNTLDDEARLDNLISLMTLEEKIGCLWLRPFIPRLGITGNSRISAEGLHGVALSGPANWAVKGDGESVTTTFPQAIGLAQMWDTDLIREIASHQATECRYLYQSPKYKSAGLIVFAPNADLGRDIRWGRTEECYGEDPFLVAETTVAFIKGLQGDHPKYWKTASLMKHFLANSNENDRYVDSSDFDDRLFREYYAYPFYKGITEGGSNALMAAYNKYNGIPCTVHPVLRDVVMCEWGVDGIIETDGGAFKRLVNDHKYYPDLQTAAAECIDAGINLFLDDYKPSLTAAVENGKVSEAEIESAVRGVFRVMLKIGQLDRSPDNPYLSIGVDDDVDPWTKPETHALVRKATVKSIVLMKNEDRLLPLDKTKIKSVAVIGPSSDLVVSDWYAGTPPYTVSIVDGIRGALGDDVTVAHAENNNGGAAVDAAAECDVAIVCVGNHPLSYGLKWGRNHVASDGREEVDRQAITLEQEDLVRLVRQANPNTILCVVSSFPYAIGWSKENVPAIVHVSQSSQELGNAVADVLLGNESPAGRLVQTWSASITDLPPLLDYDIRNGRTYMYASAQPLFAFGHGLTYTTFDYADVRAGVDGLAAGIADRGTVTVSVDVTNTGTVDSDEVVQMYASFPDAKVDRPRIALKGFRRVHIPAGQTMTVAMDVTAEDLAYWNVDRHSFVVEPGRIELSVGASSDDLRGKAVITVSAK